MSQRLDSQHEQPSSTVSGAPDLTSEPPNLAHAADRDGAGGDLSTAERLVDAAGRIFAAKGADATVREICKAAGCSVAAINYYFGDKKQLYIHCVQTACERKQKLFPLPEVTQVPAEHAGQALRGFLRAIVSRIAASTDQPDSSLGWQNTLMLREVLAPSEGVTEMLCGPFNKDFRALDSLIQKLLGKDLYQTSFREDLLTQILARCMFLKTGGNLRNMLGLDTNNNEDPRHYADCICDSILMQIKSARNSSSSREEKWSGQDNKASTGVD